MLSLGFLPDAPIELSADQLTYYLCRYQRWQGGDEGMVDVYERSRLVLLQEGMPRRVLLGYSDLKKQAQMLPRLWKAHKGVCKPGFRAEFEERRA
jgi:hypothetical protein